MKMKLILFTLSVFAQHGKPKIIDTPNVIRFIGTSSTLEKIAVDTIRCYMQVIVGINAKSQLVTKWINGYTTRLRNNDSIIFYNTSFPKTLYFYRDRKTQVKERIIVTY